METDKVVIVVCLTLFLVIGINAALYVALRRGQEASLIDLTRKSFQHLRDPWQEEDQSLKELSRRVAGLKQAEQPGGKTQENPPHDQ